MVVTFIIATPASNISKYIQKQSRKQYNISDHIRYGSTNRVVLFQRKVLPFREQQNVMSFQDVSRKAQEILQRFNPTVD
jgi:hypothetical protein